MFFTHLTTRLRLGSAASFLICTFLLSQMTLDLLATPPAAYAADPNRERITINKTEFVDSAAIRFFVSGLDYRGHVDRVNLLWERFDVGLIRQDFEVIVAGGYNAIRVPVQRFLADQIKVNNYTNLDTFISLAQQYNLRVLFVLAKYNVREPDLGNLAQIDRLIGRHLAGSPVVLGYDLADELTISSLASDIYPADVPLPPLITEQLIDIYDERVSPQTSLEMQAAGEPGAPPDYLGPEQAYTYANIVAYYGEFISDLTTWVEANRGATPFDFFNSNEAVKWMPFTKAVDDTIQAYINLRQSALRSGDSQAYTTLGWAEPDLARMPANNSLSFVSYHRLIGDGAGGVSQTLNQLEFLRKYYNQKPFMLENFGYSNASDTTTIPQLRTASNEQTIWLYMYGRAMAGGFKKQFSNIPRGNGGAVENNYGLLDDKGKPKVAYYAARSLHRVAELHRIPNGDFGKLSSTDNITLEYNWGAVNSFFGNTRQFSDHRIQITQKNAAPWAIWWLNADPGIVYVSTTEAAVVSLNMQGIFPGWPVELLPTLNIENGPPVAFTPKDRVTTSLLFGTQPNTIYVIRGLAQRPAFARTKALGFGNTLYFDDTGHNLSNGFKEYWQRNGGIGIYGIPISEEFEENGFTVQYFQRARFEYHPEFRGTKSEVLLGLLGNVWSDGRRSELGFVPILPFIETSTDRYFPETNHSLRGVFKDYWERNGGLAQFGYPISEEFNELNLVDNKVYTVQYFERNRFEYHPEFVRTPQVIQLGLLGFLIARANGWTT